MWNCGCHMLALNYQTPDLSMQVNRSKFVQNGSCGYVLQPDCFLDPQYNPFRKDTLKNVDPITITLTVRQQNSEFHILAQPCDIPLQILGARHLPKAGRGISTPFVEVEVIGAPYDSHNKYKTGNNNDNGLNPTWNDVCEFDIINPDVAMLRFVVQDEDMFGDPNFLGQASFPVRCLRTGSNAASECPTGTEDIANLVYVQDN